MAPGRRLSMMSTTRDSEIVEAPADVPRRRGKAKGLAVKNHKKINNNQKPRVEFRMNAPLACRNWKKVEAKDKKDLLDWISESFEVDLHLPHVRRAVNRFIGQRLRSFRNTLYKHYKGIPAGKDKRQHPHEDVQQADWIGLCVYFESDKFKKLSAKNTGTRKKQTVNHCCGSKPFVRYREELKNQETQEEPGRISMYHHTRWVCSEAEANYNAMTALQSVPTPANETPLTEDQVYDKVLGARPGYVNGLGHGQDPFLASALSEFEYVEESQRNALDAEGRA